MRARNIRKGDQHRQRPPVGNQKVLRKGSSTRRSWAKEERAELAISIYKIRRAGVRGKKSEKSPRSCSIGKNWDSMAKNFFAGI